MKRLALVLLVLGLLVPAVALAGSGKFTFNDVTFSDGTVGELEASSKVKKNFTTCSYFSDDYEAYLGYFQSAEFASEDAEEVLAFCLEHYEDRETG